MIRDINDRILFFLSEGKWTPGMHDIYDEWVHSGECDVAYDRHIDDDSYWTVIDKKNYFNWRKAFAADHFTVRPIGLTMEQIVELKPPHNPAKITDPRAKEYVKKFGQISWEVDALTPAIMTEIVTEALDEEMDMDQFDNIMREEKEDKITIRDLIDKLK